MNSWLKEDGVPMWWPPKLDDLYQKEDPLPIKLAYAFGGWFTFTVLYGLLIFYVFLLWRVIKWLS